MGNVYTGKVSTTEFGFPSEFCSLYRGSVLISGVGIEGFHALYTEVSSFQGVGIEGFLHCIKRCPYFRVLE